jgi:hypothetical protein
VYGSFLLSFLLKILYPPQKRSSTASSSPNKISSNQYDSTTESNGAGNGYDHGTAGGAPSMRTPGGLAPMGSEGVGDGTAEGTPSQATVTTTTAVRKTVIVTGKGVE